MLDLTFYRYFDDFELQKSHIDEMTIFALILLFLEFENLHHDVLFSTLKG